jgi:hypothetical protein
VNEEPILESSLDLTLTHHPRDENPKPWKVHIHLELIPLKLGIITFFWTFAPWWFYCKSTPLLVMNLKLSVKIITRLKTPLILHGL